MPLSINSRTIYTPRRAQTMRMLLPESLYSKALSIRLLKAC